MRLTMGKTKQVTLFLATLLPYVSIAIYSTLLFVSGPTITENSILTDIFNVLIIGTTILLLCIYLYLLFKNMSLSKSAKIKWLIFLVWGNLIVMIVYWFIHVRSSEVEE
jgi:hypothetical protein